MRMMWRLWREKLEETGASINVRLDAARTSWRDRELREPRPKTDASGQAVRSP